MGKEAQEMLDACISRPRAKRAALVVAMANASLRPPFWGSGL